MTQAASSTIEKMQSVGREFGTLVMVTQWTGKGRVHRQVPCLRLGQIALGDNMLFILEGQKVQGWVYLAEIRTLSIESRRSYKHPIAGAIIGAALVAAPVSALLGDPFNIAGIFGGDLFLFTGGFVTLIGAYTLYESLLSRKVPWLVVGTPAGQRAFMFTEPLAPGEEALIAAIAAALPAEQNTP